MYKLPKQSEDPTVVMCILRVNDGTWIPPDPDNRDYQEYLKWMAEGNVPLPADQGDVNGAN